MNMFKPVGASSVEEYIDMLEGERKAAIEFLHTFIQKHTGLKPFFAFNMLGYGSFRYLNYKKQEIDWPIIALASQKQYMSLYVCSLENGDYLAEKYKEKLGKVNVGKSCIRFKKLDDLNLQELRIILKKATEHPGLV